MDIRKNKYIYIYIFNMGNFFCSIKNILENLERQKKKIKIEKSEKSGKSEQVIEI